MCGLKKWVVIEIFFQSILWEAIVSCSNMGTAIPSLTLSIQYFQCQLQHCAPPPPPPQVPWRRLANFRDCQLWHCLNHVRFLWAHKTADRGAKVDVGLVLHVGDAEKFPEAPGEKKCQGSYPLSATVTIG